jgi:hypothetical protein
MRGRKGVREKSHLLTFPQSPVSVLLSLGSTLFIYNQLKKIIMKNIILSFVFMFGLLLCVSGVKEVIALSPASSVTATTASPEVMAQKSSGSATATIVREKQGVQLQFEQSSDGVDVPGSFLGRNWDSLLFGLLTFYELVARLTPTEKDNTFVKILSTILNAVVPNFKKGGGQF